MINTNINLIGIAGDPQVGKNTVAGIIQYLLYVDKMEKEGVIPPISLKDCLKPKGADFTNWDIKRFSDVLQKIAMLIFNTFDNNIILGLKNSLIERFPDILLNALFKDYQLQHEGSTYLNPYPSLEYPNWLITDLKHDNEFKAIKERGGLCIKVINIERYKPVTAMLAKTELTSCRYDFIIENFGTINDLEEEVRKMLTHFKLLEK